MRGPHPKYSDSPSCAPRRSLPAARRSAPPRSRRSARTSAASTPAPSGGASRALETEACMNAGVAVLLPLAEDERGRLAGVEDELRSDAVALPTKREAAD